MICKNCGTQMNDDRRFCPSCGQFQSAAQNEALSQANAVPVGAPMDASQDVAVEEKKRRLAGSIFVWGLLSLIFADTFFLSLLGFIFSFKVKSLVNEYEKTYGSTSGRGRIGKIFGIVGMILGLVLTVFAVFYFTALIFILLR